MTNSHPLAAHLGALGVFRGLDDDELLDVVRALQPMTMQPGQRIFERGERGEALYVVERGAVGISVDSLALARLGAGEVFGELALIDSAPRSATAECVEAGTLYRLDKSSFDALRAQLRPAAFKILRNLAATVAERLRETNEQIALALSPVANETPSSESPTSFSSAPEHEPQRALLSRLAFWRR
jgi:CRP-like cAMP-binding protein